MRKDKELPKELVSEIYETIGASSMCWESLDKAGAFNDQNAKTLGKILETRILDHMVKRPETFKEGLMFFIKGFPDATIKMIFTYSFQALLLWIGFHLFWPLTYTECVGVWMVLRGIRNGIYNDNKIRKDDVKNDDIKCICGAGGDYKCICKKR